MFILILYHFSHADLFLDRCLHRIPSPWTSRASYEITADMYAAARRLNSQAQPQPDMLCDEPLSPNLFGSILNRKIMAALYLKCPVIIINLDSRVDR
jgi:hypothetical protein